MKYYAFSDIGLKRTNNEDVYAVYGSAANGSNGSPRMFLFSVADGLCGHSCGEMASSLACGELKQLFDYDNLEAGSDAVWFVRRIEELVHAIDRHILQEADEHPEWKTWERPSPHC